MVALIARQPSAKRVTDEYTKSMKEQEDARKRNLATQEAQFTAQEQEIGGLAKHAQTLEDANKLLGLNADERFKGRRAQRAMQIQELEYLLVAERSNANDEGSRFASRKDPIPAKIRGLGKGAFEGRSRKRFQRHGRGITDALMRGFDGGKGIVENFIDTTKNMFATLILRPRIKRWCDTGDRRASLFGMAPASAAGAGGADGLGMVSNIAGVGGMFGAGRMASYAATGLGTRSPEPAWRRA